MLNMSDIRLIERWLPISALGEESVRERRSMTALPPIYYLHVWWARRPLVASRAAVLASLLPADADRGRFLRVIGIHGDPVATRRRIDAARRKGERFEGQAYSYARAFSYFPVQADRQWLTTGLGGQPANITILDPTAGGGSIPIEATRCWSRPRLRTTSIRLSALSHAWRPSEWPVTTVGKALRGHTFQEICAKRNRAPAGREAETEGRVLSRAVCPNDIDYPDQLPLGAHGLPARTATHWFHSRPTGVLHRTERGSA